MEDMLCTLTGGNERINQSVEAAVSSQLQGNSEVEPSECMTFDSEDAARAYYDEYAGRMGFLTRVLSSRRSERDGSIISRGLGCRSIPDSHKSAKISNEIGEKRREGCTAMFVVKKEMPERWVVRKFVRDHNHPLVPGNRTAFDERDKKIQELTAELRVKKRLSAAYREQLLSLMQDVENHTDHLTVKVRLIRDNLKELETQRLEFPNQGKPS